MQKKIYAALTLLVMASLALAACGPAATPTEEITAPPETAAPTEAPTVPPVAFQACQVTDTGGIDDKSFNATAWKGIEDAQAQLGVEGFFLESQQQTDYARNIEEFLDQGCDLIVTVGFLLGDDTAAAAQANPDQLFAIVDFDFADFSTTPPTDVTYDNVKELTFKTDEAAFLAGYMAAGVTQTGVVGTFGGLQIPTVTIFMDGFYYGVQHYNTVHGTSVSVLGWDPMAQTGLFTGNFESTDDGRAMGVTLMDEGADIIMPVAGPVGLGTAAAAQERGNVYVIGVDSDWTVSAAEYAPIVLTSVLKNMDVAVFGSIQEALDGTFAGGLYVGTLENGGVGIAQPTAPMDAMVSPDLWTEVQDLADAIISGEVSTTGG
ncbi:MAG TPA: BMP family ABC transporter substrate-binding protein [Alphaproteobacteria bacterium]